MTFDETHGWVERGTPGVHSGAVVQDVAYEVAALDRIHAAPPTPDPRWLRDELAFGTTAREAMAQGATNAARRMHWMRQSMARYVGLDMNHGDSRTAVTTYRMDGDTLRIVHTATLPMAPQMVDVTLNLTADGGES